MKVVNEIQIYEVNGQEKRTDNPTLIVKSHWNYTDRVVLECPNGQTFTVIARDLNKAITNACNHGMF